MEILVHVSAPSSTRDDARYRAQVAAICAFEPVSRQSLISDDHHGVALPSADAPESVEHAEPAGPSLLLQTPELISAPSSVSRQSAADATAAIAGQENGARQTSTDSLCDRDLKDQRRKKPPGNPPSPCAGGCPESEQAANGIVTATVPATTPANANANANTRPCPRRDLQPILPSPETNHIRPSAPAPTPAPANQTRDPLRQISFDDQPQPALDSLGSVISVIPDSQPELSTYTAQPCHRITRSLSPLHEEEDPGRSPKRQRVEGRPAMGQTISAAAAPESTNLSHAGHHTEKALPKDKSPSAPLTQGPYHVFADPPLSSTETRHDHHQHQHRHPSRRDDPSLQHQHHFHLIGFLSTLPLTLQPPPPPISTSTFTTHITPTLAMLTERLKPARTYKPTHQSRELDKLERGYWLMRINVILTKPEAGPAPAQERERGQASTKDISGSGGSSGWGPSSNPQTWSEAEFTRFWTFLSDFITKDARAGWGVWCIVDRIEPDSVNRADTDANIKPNPPTADDALVPMLLKVYAWGEVAMHIYLMLYLASDRRVRGMGLRWMDSWEKVVIQMP